MGVRKLVKRIAKDGCYNISCDRCPFSSDGTVCFSFRNSEEIIGFEAVKSQAIQWLKDHPKQKKAKEEHKFKVGDRVVHEEYGVGTVLFIHPELEQKFAVRFDVENDELHGCRIFGGMPKCKDGHGWWCRENELTKAPERRQDWDGEFVPGKFYISNDVIVLCVDGEPVNMMSFCGVGILGQIGMAKTWNKSVFKPCEVEIKVKS